MLPDFPKVKREVLKRHTKHFFDAHAENMAPFDRARQNQLHEGHRYALIRETGAIDEMKFKTISSVVKIKVEEVENLTEDEIATRFKRMATQMASQQKQFAYERIHETIKAVGNEVKTKGPVSGEVLLQMFEKMQIDFEDNGRHNPLTVICSEEARPEFMR